MTIEETTAIIREFFESVKCSFEKQSTRHALQIHYELLQMDINDAFILLRALKEVTIDSENKVYIWFARCDTDKKIFFKSIEEFGEYQQLNIALAKFPQLQEAIDIAKEVFNVKINLDKTIF